MVDVVLNAYGKPWQTVATLESLLRNSSRHIGKIYMTVESVSPHLDDMSVLWDFIKARGITANIPVGHFEYPINPSIHDNIKYQFGIDSSDKDHVFICHNDIKFYGDIIGEMIDRIGTSAGIGRIGQCWNCPAFVVGACDDTRWEEYHPTYGEAVELHKLIAHPREKPDHIQRPPMPLPECRLNEFACLLDRRVLVKEQKNGIWFGLYDGLDLGQRWFRELVLKGYKFTNYDIYAISDHGYWSAACGHATQRSERLYFEAEDRARKDVEFKNEKI